MADGLVHLVQKSTQRTKVCHFNLMNSSLNTSFLIFNVSEQAEQVQQKFRKKIICTVFLQQNYHDVPNRRHAHKIFFFCACALFDRRRKLSLVWKTVQVVVVPNNFFAFARSGGGGRAQLLSPSKGLFLFSVPARLSLN